MSTYLLTKFRPDAILLILQVHLRWAEGQADEDGRDLRGLREDGHGQQGPPDDEDRRHDGRRRGELRGPPSTLSSRLKLRQGPVRRPTSKSKRATKTSD